jgi:2-polyprenyl-3-methyl-5-hydroxy-6-metoxy-1,4-benzoquinol methylase
LEQRFTFDGVAALYGGVRPVYPEPLFNDIIAFAGLAATDRILEIGCGTGQATQGFARRGFSILALDPGSDLIGIARENLADFPNIHFEESTFEAWQSEMSAFKLVVAAQSFHWVAPDIRFAKTASQLTRTERLRFSATYRCHRHRRSAWSLPAYTRNTRHPSPAHRRKPGICRMAPSRRCSKSPTISGR